MYWYHVMIIMVAALGAVAALKDRRALFVIILCTLSYSISVLYFHYNLAYPVAFAAFCDGVCAWLLYMSARYRWELLMEWGFLSMMLVNLVYGYSLFGGQPSPLLYQSLLELITLFILLFSASRRYLNMIERYDVVSGFTSRVIGAIRPVARSLNQKRPCPPWWMHN